MRPRLRFVIPASRRPLELVTEAKPVREPKLVMEPKSVTEAVFSAGKRLAARYSDWRSVEDGRTFADGLSGLDPTKSNPYWAGK